MVSYYQNPGDAYVTTSAATTWTAWNTSTSSTTAGVWTTWNTSTSSTTAGVWTTWIDTTEATTATTTTMVWRVWNDGTGQTYQKCQSVYSAPPLTKEEQAKLDKTMRLRAEAEAARAEKERLEKEAADKKADELLIAQLDAKQKEQYRKERMFRVIVGDIEFELTSKWAGNVREFAKDGKPVARFCIHPRERVPIPDLLLAQKLMLETDQESFRKIANRTELANVG